MKLLSALLGMACLTAGFSLAKTAPAHDPWSELRGEARQVRSTALYMERISGESATTWEQMDKQWNIIKPAQEAMASQVSRLESMTKSLTPAEQQALTTAKPKVEDITAQTHELRTMLDRRGMKVQDPKFKSAASRIAGDASAVAHAAEVKKAP